MISSRFFNRIFLYFCDDPEYVQRCVYYSNPTFKNQIYLRQKYKNISSEKEKKTLTFVQFLYIFLLILPCRVFDFRLPFILQCWTSSKWLWNCKKKVLNVTVYDFGNFVLDKKINKNAPFAIQEIFFILSPFVLWSPDFSMDS